MIAVAMGSLNNEEAVRTLSAGLMLLAVFGLALYYALTAPQQSNQAVKLIIVKPSQLPQGIESELIVKAVNKQGLVDPSRDDLVKITLGNSSHAKLGFSDRSGTIWSSTLMIRLEAGQGRIKFLDTETERVRIYAEWMDGKTPLEPFVAELYSGWRVS